MLCEIGRCKIDPIYRPAGNRQQAGRQYTKVHNISTNYCTTELIQVKKTRAIADGLYKEQI